MAFRLFMPRCNLGERSNLKEQMSFWKWERILLPRDTEIHAAENGVAILEAILYEIAGTPEMRQINSSNPTLSDPIVPISVEIPENTYYKHIVAPI